MNEDGQQSHTHLFMKGIFVPIWCATGVSGVLLFVIRRDSPIVVALLGYIWATLPLYLWAFRIGARVRKNPAGAAGTKALSAILTVINLAAIVHSWKEGTPHIGFGRVAIWRDILQAIGNYDAPLVEALCTFAGTGICLQTLFSHHRLRPETF
jgi:hypothetical protein